jgi:hypothetical protein
MNDRQQKQPLRKLRAKGRAIAGTQEFGSGERGEQVGLRVQVIGGEFDGQAIPWYGHFTPAAEERTIEQLQIAGSAPPSSSCSSRSTRASGKATASASSTTRASGSTA